MKSKFAIIVPTLNEALNVNILYEQILAAMDWTNDYEIIFVDDNSIDGTLNELYTLSQNNKCRFIRRIGRKGLSSACIEGMLSSSAQYFAVIDADLQHDTSKLKDMFQALQSDESLQLVVATRYSQTGSTGDWGYFRKKLSRLGTGISNLFLHTKISDPMSGFFAIRRDLFESVVEKLSCRGFKILLDIILAYKRPINFKEIPYTFRLRQHGNTKLNFFVCIDFLIMFLDHLLGRFIHIDFLIYILIGLFGAAVHVIALSILVYCTKIDFIYCQIIATVFALTCNFVGNNFITFFDKKLNGLMLVFGYLKYFAFCLFGLFSNTCVSYYLFNHGVPWLISGCIGAIFGSFVNFFFSKFFVWNSKK